MCTPVDKTVGFILKAISAKLELGVIAMEMPLPIPGSVSI